MNYLLLSNATFEKFAIPCVYWKFYKRYFISICQIAVLFYLMIIVYWGKNWGKVWGTKDIWCNGLYSGKNRNKYSLTNISVICIIYLTREPEGECTSPDPAKIVS